MKRVIGTVVVAAVASPPDPGQREKESAWNGQYMVE